MKAGDTLRLELGGTERIFRVASVAAYDTVFLRNTRGFNALVSEECLRGLDGVAEGYNRILVAPEESVSTGQLVNSLSEALPNAQVYG